MDAPCGICRITMRKINFNLKIDTEGCVCQFRTMVTKLAANGVFKTYFVLTLLISQVLIRINPAKDLGFILN